MLTMNRLRPTPTAWLLSGLCAMSGTGLYILTAGGPYGGWANLLWSSLYGLGFLVLSLFLSPLPGLGGGILLIVGGFLWPLILTIFIARCVEASLHSFKRQLTIVLILSTNIIIYPMEYAPGTIVYYLPVYGIFLEKF